MRDYSKMNQIMKTLGCEGSDGQYRSFGGREILDFKNVADNDILRKIADLFFVKGYNQCKIDFKNFLETTYVK